MFSTQVHFCTSKGKIGSICYHCLVAVFIPIPFDLRACGRREPITSGNRASVALGLSQFTSPEFPQVLFIDNSERIDEQLDGLHTDCSGWDLNPD